MSSLAKLARLGELVRVQVGEYTVLARLGEFTLKGRDLKGKKS
jgi:hypothetical protein